jgi:hypothetical protein
MSKQAQSFRTALARANLVTNRMPVSDRPDERDQESPLQSSGGGRMQLDYRSKQDDCPDDTSKGQKIRSRIAVGFLSAGFLVHAANTACAVLAIPDLKLEERLYAGGLSLVFGSIATIGGYGLVQSLRHDRIVFPKL